MKPEKPILSRSAKSDLLRKFAQRYPNLQQSAFETISSILNTGQRWDRFVNHNLEQEGLSQGRYYVLLFLFSQELEGASSASPSQIADGLSVTRPTITWLLDGLERDGFLERKNDSKDRRALTVNLTDKGRNFLDEFVPAQGGRINAALANLDEEERRTLRDLLAKLIIPEPAIP